MSWQLKGWLLLTSALVATSLVASTAGAVSAPPADALTLARQPQVEMRITIPASPGYDG